MVSIHNALKPFVFRCTVSTQSNGGGDEKVDEPNGVHVDAAYTFDEDRVDFTEGRKKQNGRYYNPGDLQQLSEEENGHDEQEKTQVEASLIGGRDGEYQSPTTHQDGKSGV